MTRYATLTPEEFTEHAANLLRPACPKKEDAPLFNTRMAVVKVQGTTWIEGLEYVVAQRSSAMN